jgi:hypothetical protein
MTTAICFNCGYTKTGAFVICKSCNVRPIDNNECVYSMLMTDNYFKNDALKKMSEDVRRGEKLKIDPQTYGDMLMQVIELKNSPMGKMLFEGSTNDENSERDLLRKDFDYLIEKLSDANKEIKYALNIAIGTLNEYLVSSFGSIEQFKQRDPKTKLDYLKKIKDAEKNFEKDNKYEFQIGASIFAMLVATYVNNDKELEYEFGKKLNQLFSEVKPISKDADVKSIINCPRCQKRYKVPLGKELEITCSSCNHIWIIKT